VSLGTMAPMEIDHNGLEVLTRDESLYLLGTVPVARIGVSMGALPVILPVNFTVAGGEIVIRTAEGTKLDAALANAVVAVEADDFDVISHSGWSVLVRGTSRVLTLPGELERARGLSLRPWAGDTPDRYVAISTDLVSGRRIHSPYFGGVHGAVSRSAHY
jgi:nitroimidazol reductase NimA-like FMN-containing flavoprotein (pyridoxamine 5'-phosphate oxidase superfamily)